MKTLGYGLQKKCPHCGKGALFQRWMKFHPRCSNCNLVYGHTSGDTWAFWTIGDRFFVVLALVAAYFLSKQEGMGGFAALMIQGSLILIIAAALIWTMPHRMGVCIALDYLLRKATSHPDDEYPPLGRKKDTFRG